LSTKKGLKIKYASKPKLDKVSLGKSHNGVVLRCSKKNYIDVKKISDLNLTKKVGNVICIIDNVKDQYNVAGLIRSCLYFGCDAIIFNRQDRPDISSNIASISGGASELVQLYSIRFIKKFIQEAKKENYTILSTKADKDNDDDKNDDHQISENMDLVKSNSNTYQESTIDELKVDLLKQNVILVLTANPANHKNCIDYHINLPGLKERSKLLIVETLNSCVQIGVILNHLRNNFKY
jgi:hypothetical protein